MITIRRKFIYLAAAVILAVVIIIVLIQKSAEVPTVDIAPSRQTADLSDKVAPAVYVVPKVFPNDATFDLSVFKSNFFQTLQPQEEIKVDSSELGRDNPFKKY
ncbi:MAG: hypothetical protein HY545_01965 [Candidatus Doudnabacteria bacterium]|nr:hypothetical protein [Candidatus Doudnabacteria bacterium]